MASTITGLSAGNAIQTEQCAKDFLAGTHKTTDTFKLVLLNLALGSLTLTQANATCYADISAAETVNNSGTAYTAGGIALTTPVVALSGGTRKATLTFDTPVNLSNADFDTTAYAIINNTTNGVGGKVKPILVLGKWATTQSPRGTGANNFSVTIPADAINYTVAAAA